MTYSETLTYLYAQLPMFHRIGSAAYKANLNNTLAICKLLGNPENKFKSIHIAGTNGKGSVSHMLAAILQSAGYKTGLYTSPHLKDFRERIKINGKVISKNYVANFVRKYKNDFEKIKPSFFEWTVGLAFDYFSEEQVDIAIIETGLGGRLDSTNVITPLLSIITNISYDHQKLLGDTLEKIAFEKAGIIKKNGIVIVSEKQKNASTPLSVTKIFEDRAKAEGALLLYTEDFIPKIKNVDCALKGNYQKQNIRTAVIVSEMLCHMGFNNVEAKHIKKGLKQVIKLTGLRGRWETLSTNPLVVADVAHNESGIKEVFRQVKTIPHKNLHVVFGTSNDKNPDKFFPLLPEKATYYFCKADIPRAMNENMLAEEAKKYGLRGEPFPHVKSAFASAKKNAGSKDFILVTGSAFVVAEVI